MRDAVNWSPASFRYGFNDDERLVILRIITDISYVVWAKVRRHPDVIGGFPPGGWINYFDLFKEAVFWNGNPVLRKIR